MILRLRRMLILCALPVLIAACAPVLKTEVIQPVPAPLRELDILLHVGAFQSAMQSTAPQQPVSDGMRESLERLVPALFVKNGVRVKEFKSVSTTVYQAEMLRAVEQADAGRHLLLIESEKYRVGPHGSAILFEARMIDRKSRRSVWRASVEYVLEGKKPNARAEIFARDLLLSLAKDGLVVLPSDGPLDLKGKRIEDSPVWASER